MAGSLAQSTIRLIQGLDRSFLAIFEHENRNTRTYPRCNSVQQALQFFLNQNLFVHWLRDWKKDCDPLLDKPNRALNNLAQNFMLNVRTVALLINYHLIFCCDCRYRGFLRVDLASKQNPSKSHRLGTSLWHQPNVGLPKSCSFSIKDQQNGFALRASGNKKERKHGPLCDACLSLQGGGLYLQKKRKTAAGATWQLFYQRRTDHCHDSHSLNHIWSVHVGTGKSHCVYFGVLAHSVSPSVQFSLQSNLVRASSLIC